MKETIQQLWQNWYFHDGVALLVVLISVRLFQRLRRNTYWQLALRDVFRRRMVTVSFVVLCFYAAIAILDSFGFHPPMRNDDGSLRKDPASGKVIMDQRGISLLDLVLTPLRSAREKTYSAPLATHQFTKETLSDASGQTIRDYPALAYPRRHLLGTDRVGNDVLYLSLKSIRTGMLIGGFTTMLVIPFAIFFGVVAGYFGRAIDDLIQYVYTVLGSIPSVLLIASFMIIFGTGLPQLCIIMGITSWTGLCRVLRGETYKLREMEYVQAAQAMGLSSVQIMKRHIVPNLMHIVLITAVLGFSGRVLAEAVLTYIGIGVGADTISWGSMINDALGELARSPVIWWKLVAALLFTVGLVLPANLFGDALRDALDPKLRTR
ncbi:MAG: ABC transporter permease [Verrucomicrobia bacterium]|nr:ABC transporter permease [Verrucomicrobiota bacterium]